MERKAFNPDGNVGKNIGSANSPAPGSGERKTFTPDAGALKRRQKLPPKEKPTIIDHSKAGTGLLKAWSASRLKDYETCPYMAKLKYIDKVKEPKPEGKNPLDRGNAVHAYSEAYITGDQNVIEDGMEVYEKDWDGIFLKYQPMFEEAHEFFLQGKVECEQEWGFTTDWAVTGWMSDDTWARIKLDYLYLEDPISGVARDWKTGKKFGNEMTHATQGIIYTIGTFMKYPELEFLQTEFHYFDQPDAPTVQRYNRKQAMEFVPRITDRAVIMTSAQEFAPRPSPRNCRFCVGKKTGTCEWAVE